MAIDIQSILRQIPQRRRNTLIDYDPVTLTDVRTPTQGEVFASIAGDTVSRAVEAYTKSKMSEQEASRQFDILKFQEELKDERQEKQNTYQQEIKKIDRKFDLDKLEKEKEYQENLNKEKEETKRRKDQQDFILDSREQDLRRKDQQKRLEIAQKELELAQEEARNKQANDDLNTSIKNINNASDIETVLGEIAGMRDDTFASQSTKRIFKADYDKHVKALEVIKSLDSEFGGKTYKEILELENGDKKLEAYFNNPAWFNKNFENTVTRFKEKKTKLEAFHNDYQLNKGWYDWVAKGGVKTMFKNTGINKAGIALIENSKASEGQDIISRYINVQFAKMKDEDKQKALSIKNNLELKLKEKSVLLNQIDTQELPAGEEQASNLEVLNKEIDNLSNAMNNLTRGVNLDDNVSVSNNNVNVNKESKGVVKQPLNVNKATEEPEPFDEGARINQAVANKQKSEEMQKERTRQVLTFLQNEKNRLSDIPGEEKTVAKLTNYLNSLLKEGAKFREGDKSFQDALKSVGFYLPNFTLNMKEKLDSGAGRLKPFSYTP